MNEASRFTCSTSGDELLAIGQALRAAVAEGVVERERGTDGLRLRITQCPRPRRAILDFVRREQECCSFFDFTMAEDPDGFSVAITGPPEAAPLLDLLFQLAEPRAATAP